MGEVALARRNDHTPEDLRRLALDAARAIAASDGLRGVTVRRVAERIGYAPGTLYNLFDNLDALIVTLNGETLGRLGAALAAAAAASDVAARPSALVDAYFDFVEAEPQLWTVLFEHRLPEGTSLPDWYRDGLAALVDGAVAALEPVMRAWTEASRREAVVAMWAGLHGISTLAVAGKLGLVATTPPRRLGHLIVERIISAGPTGAGSSIAS